MLKKRALSSCESVYSPSRNCSPHEGNWEEKCDGGAARVLEEERQNSEKREKANDQDLLHFLYSPRNEKLMHLGPVRTEGTQATFIFHSTETKGEELMYEAGDEGSFLKENEGG